MLTSPKNKHNYDILKFSNFGIFAVISFITTAQTEILGTWLTQDNEEKLHFTNPAENIIVK